MRGAATSLPALRSRSGGDWSGLFWSAFRSSRNAMALVDQDRAFVDVNAAFVRLLGYKRAEVVGRPVAELLLEGPYFSKAGWRKALASGQFAGDVEIHHADGSVIAAQWDASTETVTGRQYVLVVALSTSRWGGRFRRAPSPDDPPAPLTRREREIVSMVAMGATGPEIADELHIAHDTVRTHVRNAMAHLGARSRAHLVAKALAGGHIFV